METITILGTVYVIWNTDTITTKDENGEIERYDIEVM